MSDNSADNDNKDSYDIATSMMLDILRDMEFIKDLSKRFRRIALRNIPYQEMPDYNVDTALDAEGVTFIMDLPTITVENNRGNKYEIIPRYETDYDLAMESLSHVYSKAGATVSANETSLNIFIPRDKIQEILITPLEPKQP